MRIAINCRSFLDRHYAGIGRYAFNLVKSLSAIDSQNQYCLYAKTGLFSSKKLPHFTAPNFKPYHDFFKRGAQKTLGPVDIYHSPSPDALDIQNTKIIVTVHDLVYKVFPQGHTPETIQTTEKHFQEIIAKADQIICCSQSTEKDFQKYFPQSSGKTTMIYQGVDKKEFYPLPDSERLKAKDSTAKLGVKGPFLLSVGTIEPRKNIETLINVYEKLKRQNKFSGKLVCIGKTGWMSEHIFKRVEELGLKNDVLFLGFITNEELRSFYNLAEVFVFPSFYEGFGFPILEAFSCGAVVVTSNMSSCGEVAGGAALTIDPFSADAMANAIERILTDKKLKEELKAKALLRARDFSFEKTARETLKVYEEVYHLK